ncbi:type III polyketide synthase [Mycolicibacterium sp.]|uniref:type III polyketide synthase n=1 Tax=Mycolicibacterium sp. TaxID=2320850 RepID=UPI003D0EF2C3
MSSPRWPSSVIAGVRGALPPNRYSQSDITEALAQLPQFAPHADLLRRFHQTAKVDYRHLVLPLEQYPGRTDFGYTNSVFIDRAVDLGSAAASASLEEAGFGPRDVDMIVSTTVTGVAVPSLDARIAGRLGMRPDVRRVPLFGLGCVAGAAGMARVHDYLRGNPDGVAVLVSAEMCSLNFGAVGADIAGLVGTALFADGAAAVVAVGERRAEKLGITGPRIIDSASRLYPNSLRTMGWDVGAAGFQLVLSPDVPDMVGRYLRDDMTGFLAGHDLEIDDIGVWVSHPGGPKVIEAITESLRLPADALELTWRSLAEIGNVSSSSVLHILRDTMDKRPGDGSPAVMMAMGPGFCSELLLIQWQ